MVVSAGPLGDQLRVLRDELCVAPDPDVKAAHLAAMDLAMDLEWGPDQAERSPVRELPVRRRRVRTLALPVAATLGVIGLTCGLAAAGGLPGPAQRQAARVAGAVGWQIPDHFGSSSPTRHPGAGGGRDLAPTTSTSTSGADDAGTGPVTVGRRRQLARVVSGGVFRLRWIVARELGHRARSHRRRRSSGRAAGKSGAAPGQTGSTPGQSGTAPGQSGTGPGKSGDAPGRSGTAPGLSGTTSGKSGDAPGHNKAPTDG